MFFKSILQIPKKLASHPMGRGMMAYGLTFPTGCLIQEYCDKKNLENVNWKKCFRYSLYGVFISAPIVFGWMRIANRLWPKQSLASAVQKALIEQVTFAPISISLFFFTMASVDNNFDFAVARKELKRKFWDAYKVAIFYWPVVQTINFTFIPDRNRIVFVSLCGLLWVAFLAYVDVHGNILKTKPKAIESDIPTS